MTHDERIHYHMYETCEGIAEHAERIVALEKLVFDALAFALGCVWHLNEIAGYDRMEPSSPATRTFASLHQRAQELGVEL